MSTADRPRTDAPAASDVAARLREASFVRLVAAPTGDALAAMGVLARAFPGPFQATVAGAGGADRDTEADCTVALGCDAGDLALDSGGPASRTAFEAAGALNADPDPILALAGFVAAGVEPAGPVLEAAELPRRPGLALPTADPAEGLAASTLAHGPFSGDAAASRELLDGADGEDEAARRRRASLVALAVAGDPEGTDRGAGAVERLLRPYAGGPFRTVGGYADVLDALARSRPGLGVALALGAGDREAALAAWREHGKRAHEAVRTARTARYDGALVARCEPTAPLGTVARLFAEFRSPEPAVLAVADGRAVAYAADDTDAARAVGAAARETGGTTAGTAREARAEFPAEPTAFAAAFRGAV